MEIIGIAGPSCSGKSTIAGKVAERLGCDVLSLDQFFIKGLPYLYVEVDGQRLRTFERPELYDGQRMALVLEALKNESSVEVPLFNFQTREYEDTILRGKEFLVVEGFLLYAYNRLVDLIDHKYFIDIPMSVAYERRMSRKRPNEDKMNFLTVGQQEWERYGAPQKAVVDVVLDGTQDVHISVDYILKKLEKITK